MRKAVHFGAGSIGRGFIGERLHASGYEVVFADVNEELIDMINEDQGYDLQLINHDLQPLHIDHVCALSTINDKEQLLWELAHCDVITTSVWPNNLPKIAPMICEGLLLRQRLKKDSVQVLACENAIFASTMLKEEVLKLAKDDVEQIQQSAVFVNTAIARMVIDGEENGHKFVKIADDYELVIAENELLDRTEHPIEGGLYTSHLQKYIERKLFIVNSAHCIGGYFGWLYHKRYVRECFEDKAICNRVEKAMQEAADLIALKHGFAKEELEAFIDYTIRRYITPGVYDDITRVCRSPIRKIAANDRLVLPIVECARNGLANTALCEGLAAAYLYRNQGEAQAVEIQEYIATHGIREAVAHYSVLDENPALIDKVVAAYYHIKEEIKNETTVGL